MPRKESKAVPEGNGPVPQQEEFGSGQPTLVDVKQKIEEPLYRWWMADEIRVKNQCVASLNQDARQSRLAMEVDWPPDTKTRERTEATTTAVQAVHGDSFIANRVDPGSKTTSISFGV